MPKTKKETVISGLHCGDVPDCKRKSTVVCGQAYRRLPLPKELDPDATLRWCAKNGVGQVFDEEPAAKVAESCLGKPWKKCMVEVGRYLRVCFKNKAPGGLFPVASVGQARKIIDEFRECRGGEAPQACYKKVVRGLGLVPTFGGLRVPKNLWGFRRR